MSTRESGGGELLQRLRGSAAEGLRLLYEFCHGPLTAGWRILETGAVSYGQPTPYLPIRDLLSTYFQIDDQDDEPTIQEKIDKRLAWETVLQETRPVVQALLDVGIDDLEWQTLDPPQRHWRIPVYTFKHALTHEVAYGSLLQGQRRMLHARIVEAIERLWADRLTTQVEQLAHHALRGEMWEKVLVY